MTYQRLHDPEWMKLPGVKYLSEEDVEAEMMKHGGTCYRVFLSDGSDDIAQWTPRDWRWGNLIQAHHEAETYFRHDLFMADVVKPYVILAFDLRGYRRITEKEIEKAISAKWRDDKRIEAEISATIARVEEKKAVSALWAHDQL